MMILRLFLFVWLLSFLACSQADKTKTLVKPNIIFIYTDDQAPWAISLAGNDEVYTPNIDRIGLEGAYLPEFFTPTPVCSPTRASLLTSRYSTETGITDWLNPSWPHTLYGTEPDHGLDSAYTSWVELLQQSGYRTGLVGKWHLGDNPEQRPEIFGYDYYMGFLGGGTEVKNPKLEENGEMTTFPGFTTDILTNKAIEFISFSSDQPFLLSLHYRAPHGPWLPLPEADWEPYKEAKITFPHPYYPGLDNERLRQMTREYYGSVASIDRNVGKILKTLDSLQISDNTILVFTSDHGYNMGHNGTWHKGNGHWILDEPPAGTENVPEGQRPNLYDNSLKVPAVIRWPDKISPGTVVSKSVTVLDWFPTLLAMAGIEQPAHLLVRGRNFLPLLTGQEPATWQNELFGQYSTHHQSRTHMRMYRTREYKLIIDILNPERNELYHLMEDPEETTNLYFEPVMDSVKSAMHTILLEKMKDIDDPLVQEYGQ